MAHPKDVSAQSNRAKGTMKIKPFSLEKGYSQIHNHILDFIMPTLSGSEWKILCYILRHTVGFQKYSDAISYSQIMKGRCSATGDQLDLGAGVKSATTVGEALKELTKRGYITATAGAGKWDISTYTLNTEFEVDLEAEEPAPTPKNEVEPTPKNEVPLLQKMEQRGAFPTPKIGDTIKTPFLKKIEKETHTQTARERASEQPVVSVCVGEISEGKRPTRDQVERYAANNQDKSGAVLGRGWINKALSEGHWDDDILRWIKETENGLTTPGRIPADNCQLCNTSGFTLDSILSRGTPRKCAHPKLVGMAQTSQYAQAGSRG